MAKDNCETAARDFIRRWEDSGAAERANYTMFLTELCALLGVAGPNPSRPDDRENAVAWPKSLAEQAQAVRAALGAEAAPATAAELSRRFKGAKADRIGELPATLTALGQARSVGGERFVS